MSEGLFGILVGRLIPRNTNRRMLARALLEVSREPASFGRRFNATNWRNLGRYARMRFTCPICGARSRPLYDFPDVPRRIEHHIGVLRETLQCQICMASMRQRSLAVALLEILAERLGADLDSIAALAARGLGGLRVLDTDNFSAISRLLRSLSGYTRCSFLPHRPFGSQIEPNLYNEDLQKLTFGNAAFDIVLTSDVMEHVRDCEAAHREIHRVLAPGGAYVFNVPCDFSRPDDLILVDTSTDEDVFLCEPQYHGDPLSGGILAYRVFGRSLVPRLERLGFAVSFRMIKDAEHLIIDGDVFVARKAAMEARGVARRESGVVFMSLRL